MVPFGPELVLGIVTLHKVAVKVSSTSLILKLPVELCPLLPLLELPVKREPLPTLALRSSPSKALVQTETCYRTYCQGSQDSL